MKIGPPEILVVDDTPANLKLLCGLLGEQHWCARASSNGELALRSALAKPPDLVLMDVEMPGIDGYETCRRFKAAPSLAAIPVIFISGLADRDDKLEGFRAGGIDYIAKPFDSLEVVARVRTHLDLHRLRNRLESLVEQRTAELQRSYEKLAAGEEQLRLMIDAAIDATWDWDRESDEVRVNERWYAALGFEAHAASVSRETWRAMIHESDQARFDRLFTTPETLDSERFLCEMRVATCQGDYRWMLLRGRGIGRSASGGASRVVGIMVDIDDRKRVALSVQAELDRHRAVLGSAHREWAFDLEQTGDRLDRDAARPADAAGALRRAARHLRSLSLAYRWLLQSEEPGRVDLAGLLTALVDNIRARPAAGARAVTLSRCDPCTVDFADARDFLRVLDEVVGCDPGCGAGPDAVTAIELIAERGRAMLRVTGATNLQPSLADPWRGTVKVGGDPAWLEVSLALPGDRLRPSAADAPTQVVDPRRTSSDAVESARGVASHAVGVAD
jgi:PAS domain S-box-containing protein